MSKSLLLSIPLLSAMAVGAIHQTHADDAAAATAMIARDTGATISIQNLGEITVHSYVAPEAAFANNTHIIETENKLVLIDTQFLLPMAQDYRAYADSLGKPIERLVITHEHPDHFLGSAAFADVPVQALEAVSSAIEANGQQEVDEKRAQFGDAIASTFVVPEVLEPGAADIDGVEFVFQAVMNAEAETQVVTKLPAHGVVSVGDIVYSGVHLILAGQPPTWIKALQDLQAEIDQYSVVLPGHGTSTNTDSYDANIAWLSKAGEFMGTAKTGDEFKSGLVETFPDLGMAAAIDFVLPFLFPDK